MKAMRMYHVGIQNSYFYQDCYSINLNLDLPFNL